MKGSAPTERHLLWVDDDGESRFWNEIACLQQAGWRVDWAVDAEQASAKLQRAEGYDLLLLDQIFPFSKRQADRRDGWGGCRLLYWLRGQGTPQDAPHPNEWQQLADREPLPANRTIPVLICSAFYDEAVTRAVRELDRELPSERQVPMLEKPVDEDYLIEEIERRHRRHRDAVRVEGAGP